MVYPETFEAVGVLDYDDWKNPKKFEYKPQDFRDCDIDIKIECCGVCGSDIHAAAGHWGRRYAPLAVGHEIVGTIVKIGSKAKSGFKLGDRVGVGAQCDCDKTCKACERHHENNCDNLVATYFGQYPNGANTMGGNASHVRVNSRFAFKIPDNMESAIAAPLLCAGITGFSPLVQAGVTKGTKVGVVGIGGIGHMTILFAKAMGAEVTAISRGYSKKEDALKLGADHYVATSSEEDLAQHRRTLDVIVNTANSFSGNGLETTMSLCKERGQFIFITAPAKDELIKLVPVQMIMSGISIRGSMVGSPDEIQDMLDFAGKHDIKPWIETIELSEENLGKAWDRCDKGDVKYRFTMVGYDKFFKN